MAKQIVITSWNMRGLGNRVKQLAVLHMVKRLGSSVVCLQETHMLPGQESPFSVKVFGTQFHSAFSSYVRGVSMLIGTSVPFVCTTSNIGPHSCSLDGLQCIIVNIYYHLLFQWRSSRLWPPFCHYTQLFLQLLWEILIIIWMQTLTSFPLGLLQAP